MENKEKVYNFILNELNFIGFNLNHSRYIYDCRQYI